MSAAGLASVTSRQEHITTPRTARVGTGPRHPATTCSHGQRSRTLLVGERPRVTVWMSVAWGGADLTVAFGSRLRMDFEDSQRSRVRTQPVGQDRGPQSSLVRQAGPPPLSTLRCRHRHRQRGSIQQARSICCTLPMRGHVLWPARAAPGRVSVSQPIPLSWRSSVRLCRSAPLLCGWSQGRLRQLLTCRTSSASCASQGNGHTNKQGWCARRRRSPRSTVRRRSGI